MKKSKFMSILLSVIMCTTLACSCAKGIDSGSSSSQSTTDTSENPENSQKPENPDAPEKDENKTATYSIRYYYEDKETGEYVLDDTLTIRLRRYADCLVRCCKLCGGWTGKK